MKVITLWNPWASWVMLGWKKIETRTHDRFLSLGGHRIGIHAGLKWDIDAITFASKYLTKEQIDQTEKFLKVGGAILGTVRIERVGWLIPEDSKDALIDCGNVKRFGLWLSDPRVIEAIPIRGRQGIWNYKF